ncbi:MAG: shikimate kinase [Bacteroidota bacterium]
MASGKTSIGQSLAKELGYEFVDTDTMIEEEIGLSINEIFSHYSEPYFRQLESKILKIVIKKTKIVVATGGGLPCHRGNMDVILKHGCPIFLKCGFEEIMKRIKKTRNRPIASKKSKNELYLLYKSRLDFYKAARFIINSSRPKEKVIQRITLLIKNLKN